jgi:hypothetical protein
MLTSLLSKLRSEDNVTLVRILLTTIKRFVCAEKTQLTKGWPKTTLRWLNLEPFCSSGSSHWLRRLANSFIFRVQVLLVIVT